VIRRYGSMPDAISTVEIAGGRDMRRQAAKVLGLRDGYAEFRHVAHRESFKGVTLREGYLYVRNRAVSSRVNANGDGFPPIELATEAPGFGYQTFLGRPVFVNHRNDDYRRARGVNVAAALHNDTAPDGSPDTWVELLKEIDAKRFPKLATALIKGQMNRTSMGVDCLASKCRNHCGNWASDPTSMCSAIPALKTVSIETRDPDGTRHTAQVWEQLAGLSFFEDSLLVEPPADATALVLGVQDHSGMAS
jgi:hypothetical protein